MSGTPKRTNWSAAADLAREALEQRQQRAREESARRAAEEQRRALERRDHLRAQALSQAATVTRSLSGLLEMPSSRFLAPETVSEIQSRISSIATEVQEARDEAGANAVLRRVATLSSQVSRLDAQARAAGQVVDQLNSELSETQRELEAVFAARSSSYLPVGSESAWGERLSRIRVAAETAGELEILSRGLTEIGSLRGEFHRAVTSAETVLQAASKASETLEQSSLQWNGFLASELRPFAEPTVVDRLTTRLDELFSRLDRASDRESVAIISREVNLVFDEIRQVSETASATRKAAHLDQEAQALARLTGEVAGLDPVRSSKHDKAGWTDLQARLASVQARLDRKELESARIELEAARLIFLRHSAEVSRKFRDWQVELDKASNEHVAALARLDAVRNDSERRRWAYPRAADLDRQLKEVESLIATDDFGKAESLALEVARETKTLAEMTDLCRAESGRLDALRLRARSAQPVEGRTFDAEGARDLQRFLDAAEAALKRGQPTEAGNLLTSALDRLDRHEKTAIEKADEWRKTKDEATEALDAARGRYETLLEDHVVGLWQSEALAGLGRQLDQAKVALEKGELAEMQRVISKLPAQSQKIVDDAGRLQLQADLQRRIADGVMKVMVEELGFSVVQGREKASDPRSSIILYASKPNGDLIDTTIEHDGRIEYDVHGRLEPRVETKQDMKINRTVKHCDEAEEQIRYMHEILRGLGIETTDLEWDDQPDPGDTGAAVENPTLVEYRAKQRQVRTIKR